MNIRWLILSVVAAGWYTSFMGGAIPFGMFSSNPECALTSEGADDTIFGMFDAVSQRERRIIDAQVQAELDAQEQRKQYEAYVYELLLVRDAKRAARHEHLVVASSQASGAPCYKLKNRVRRMELMQQESMKAFEMHKESRHESVPIDLVLSSCKEEEKRDLDFCYPRQSKDDTLNRYRSHHAQRLARCKTVQELASRYQQITSQLLTMQNDMIAALERDLEYFCAVAHKEPAQVLAQLRLQEASGQYPSMRTFDILNTRYSS